MGPEPREEATAAYGRIPVFPPAARKFLYQFHDEEKIQQEQRELPASRVSCIPDESGP
jgi:hypothetical protein